MSADEMSEKEKSTGERIAELAKERGLTLRKLAILSGVPYNTLYSAVKRNVWRRLPLLLLSRCMKIRAKCIRIS